MDEDQMVTENSNIFSLGLSNMHQPELFVEFWIRHPWNLANSRWERERRHTEWLESEEGQLSISEDLKGNDELARLLQQEEELVLEGMDLEWA